MSKIKDALPAPEQCDTCCSFNIELTTNDKIYGRTYGDWPHVFYCNDCKAAVGCHPGTFIPLGRMADRSTRQLRTKAHNEFDRLWQSGLMTRRKAYNWLASELGIDESQCHISWLSKDQLKDVATLSADYLTNNYNALLRRKVKNDAKQERRNERANAVDKRNSNEARRRKAKRRT